MASDFVPRPSTPCRGSRSRSFLTNGTDTEKYLQTDDVWYFIDTIPLDGCPARLKPFWMLVLIRLSMFCTDGRAFDVAFTERVCSGIKRSVLENSYLEYEFSLLDFFQKNKRLSASAYHSVYNLSKFFALYDYDSVMKYLCLICQGKAYTHDSDDATGKQIMAIVRDCLTGS